MILLLMVYTYWHRAATGIIAITVQLVIIVLSDRRSRKTGGVRRAPLFCVHVGTDIVCAAAGWLASLQAIHLH
jgi:hypothetical protein